MEYFEISIKDVKDIRKKSDPNSTASVVTGDVVGETSEPVTLDTPTQETTQNVIE